jgi:putative membrane protein
VKVRVGFVLATFAGVLIACGLIAREGVGAVLATLVTLGWGFVPVFAVHLFQLLCSALAWRPLVVRPWPRPLGTLYVARWIREAINGLLPVAHIGGEIVGARLLSFRGTRGDAAGASVVLDVTVEAVTQILVTLAGIVLLALERQDTGGTTNLLVEVMLAAAAVGGFIAAQRFGLFNLIERFLNPMMERQGWLSRDAIRGLHDAIQALHRDPRALAESALWHSISWLLGTIEVWLALHFMGFDIGIREALIIESLGQAAHSAGFMVPGGIGIQEGGLVLAGAALGIPADAALALSLAKRLREVMLGLPALAAWQYLESRQLWPRRVSNS